MSTDPQAARAHVCEPDAERLIKRIGVDANDIRILTFWSLEGTYPAGELRYHLGQLGMLQLMSDLADRGCSVDALICDSQSRSIVGNTDNDLELDIQVTERFIKCLKNGKSQVRRMSQLVEELNGEEDWHAVARRMVDGALKFRNFIQRHPPAHAVLEGLHRFRCCVNLPVLDEATAAYVANLNKTFPGVGQLDLLAALYASVRRPKWFDAFWLGEIAAWVARQAKAPNTFIIEANRSAYSWLTHRCFLAIGALGECGQAGELRWPTMYFVEPILCIDGQAPMQLSVRRQAIFLHHTPEGLMDRLNSASTASIESYRQWFLKETTGDMEDAQLRKALFARIQLLRKRIRPELLTHREAEAEKTSLRPDDHRIGLCLSGGGLRATFFHLGLIKLLRDLDLLKKVVGVYSVSGGSILAANLAHHWADYTKDREEATFFEAMAPLRALARADVRGRIVRRWYWPGARVDRLAGNYDRIPNLMGKELQDLPSEPAFSFLATSMKTGKLVTFNREGYHNGDRLFRCPDMSLARAVAASSAFPPLFPPMWISPKDLEVDPDRHEGVGPVTDGGVYDNLGLTKLKLDAKDRMRMDKRWCTVSLVSDASAPFEVSGADRFKSMFDRTARSTNILMKRVGDLEAARQSNAGNADDGWPQIYPIEVKIDCPPIGADLMDHFPEAAPAYCVQDDRVQALTSKIRTDLDCFSNEEVTSLMRHGYEVGLAKLTEAGMVPKGFRPRDPCGVMFPRLDAFCLNPRASPVKDTNEAVQHIRDCLEHSGVRRLGIFSLIAPPIFILLIALAAWQLWANFL